MAPFRLVMPKLIPFLFLSVLLATAGWAESPSEFEGFTSPYRDVRVGSAYTTTAIDVRVVEGDVVEQGQVLVQLDDAVSRAAVEVARQAASARGELEAAQQALKTKQRRLEQTRELHDRDHATPQELQTAEEERDEAAARVKAHEELIARRELELKRAETELYRMTVRSPLDGIVVERFCDVGEVISPAEPHLVRVVQLDPLKVIATGPAAQIQGLRVDAELTVLVSDIKHVARIEHVSPVVDAQSGMRKIHLRLPNPNNEIPCGVPCRVLLVDDSLEQTPNKRPAGSRSAMQADPAAHAR